MYRLRSVIGEPCESKEVRVIRSPDGNALLGASALARLADFTSLPCHLIKAPITTLKSTAPLHNSTFLSTAIHTRTVLFLYHLVSRAFRTCAFSLVLFDPPSHPQRPTSSERSKSPTVLSPPAQSESREDFKHTTNDTWVSDCQCRIV
jgi:hypothetical protein